jgi:serine phosphatase RsbU (regulator of sigma subunit)
MIRFPLPRRIFFWPAVFCIAFFASSSFAQGPVIIDDALKIAPVGRNLEYLVDAARSITFNDVISDRSAGKLKWVRSKEDTLGFGFSKKAYWVRFSMKNPTRSNIEFYLKQDYPLINHLSLYVPDEKGGYSETKTGNYYPFAQRPFRYKNFIFPLTIKAGSDINMYLRYESNSSMNIQLSALSPKTFRKIKDTDIIFYWMFYGILIVMFIYNLLMFLATRDWSYFFYITYIASFGLFTMSLNGMAYQYLWPNNIWLGMFATPIFMSFIIMTLLMFVRIYMEVKAFSGFWDRSLINGAVLAAITLLITFAIQNYRLSITVATGYSGIAAGIGSIMVINFVFIKKSRQALFFSIASLLFLFGVIMTVLQLFGVLPANVVTVNGILVGAAFQIMILSIGLADRINIMRNEMQALNVMLEKKVEDRTVELQTANDEIEAMNDNLINVRDSLWGEMQLAKKIQTVLLPEKPALEGYEIAAYMQPADDVGGDYYDIINTGGRDWIVIGDVSGHGVPAGLVMMMVQTSINTVIDDQPDLPPAEVLTKVNSTIYRNIQKLGENKYMTITVLASHKDGKFVFSGLHQDIMVYRKRDGAVECIDTNGMWIGILDDLSGKVADGAFTMLEGDTLLLYTDGITEAWGKGTVKDLRGPDTQMFGVDRLKEIFRKTGDRSIDEIKNSILEALGNYTCNDDVTMILLRRGPIP